MSTHARRSISLRRWVVLGGLLALVFAGAGCQLVPNDGPVGHVTLEEGSRASNLDPAIIAAPQEGQSPAQVVEGFLEAMASYQPQFPMARQFMTPEAAAEWRSDAGMLIYEDPAVVPSDTVDGRVMVTGEKVGEVGSDGGWVPAQPDTAARVEFDLVKVDGDWRINQAPDGVLTTESSFEREYYPVNLFFFEPKFDVMVPDPVYVPIRAVPEPALVKALLRGPTQWLKPYVRTVVPAGTRMQSPSVTIEGTTARIDLNDPVRQLSQEQRGKLLAQFTWTLREAAAQVDRVELSVDRVPLEVPESNWEQYAPAIADAATSAYAIADHRVQLVGERELTPVTDRLAFEPKDLAVAVSGARERSGPNRPSPTTPADRLALVPKSGRTVWKFAAGQSEPTEVGGGRFEFTNVRSASWDHSGRLWLVDAERDGSRIVVVDETGTPREISAPGLAGRDVRKLVVSRDGARVAALVDESADRTELVVGLVDADDLSVRDVRELPMGDYTTASDLAWSDIDQMVVVGKVGDEPNSMSTVSVDGAQVVPVYDAPPLAPKSVAAAPGQPLLVVSSDDSLARPDPEYGWSTIRKARIPAYPG